MRDQKPDELDRAEAGVANTTENGGGRVRGEGNEVRGGRLGVVRASCEELNLRAAVAVGRPDCARELDAIRVISE